MITFNEFLDSSHEVPVMELIDMDTVPPRVKQDYWKRNTNVENGARLCVPCDGTGNAFMYAFRACDVCGGTGVAP